MFVSLYTLCWFTQLPAQDSCKGTVLQICINWWVSHDLLSRWGQDSRHGELPLVTVNPIQKLQEPSWSARNGNSHNPFNFPSNLPGQSCQQPTVLQPYWYSMGDGVLLDAGEMWPYRFPLRQIDSYWLNRPFVQNRIDEQHSSWQWERTARGISSGWSRLSHFVTRPSKHAAILLEAHWFQNQRLRLRDAAAKFSQLDCKILQGPGVTSNVKLGPGARMSFWDTSVSVRAWWAGVTPLRLRQWPAPTREFWT